MTCLAHVTTCNVTLFVYVTCHRTTLSAKGISCKWHTCMCKLMCYSCSWADHIYTPMICLFATNWKTIENIVGFREKTIWNWSSVPTVCILLKSFGHEDRWHGRCQTTELDSSCVVQRNHRFWATFWTQFVANLAITWCNNCVANICAVHRIISSQIHFFSCQCLSWFALPRLHLSVAKMMVAILETDAVFTNTNWFPNVTEIMELGSWVAVRKRFHIFDVNFSVRCASKLSSQTCPDSFGYLNYFEFVLCFLYIT